MEQAKCNFSSAEDSANQSDLTAAKNNEEPVGSNPEELDAELDELLDESLADLTSCATPQKTRTPQPSSTSEKNDSGASNSEDAFMRALLGGAMGGAGSASEIEEHLKALLQDDPLAMSEFDKLTKSEACVGKESEKAFADTLAETLSSLSANAESLKSEMTDEELMKSFQQSLNLGAEGDGESDANFMPMMQNMMSSLLSKDILYPSLKDLTDKYPGWLSANNGKIPKKQFDLYVKQFDIVSSLCDHYNSEKPTDSQQVKDERFEKILELMTQMQDCGPPPKDIVGEMAPGLNFDADGNPQLPGMEQCSIM